MSFQWPLWRESSLRRLTKYLGAFSLIFPLLLSNMVFGEKNWGLKLSFTFRNMLCFSLNVKKRLVAATAFFVGQWGSFRCAFSLYSRVGWAALGACRMTHCCTLIFKAILGLLPSFLCSYISQKGDRRRTYMLSVLNVCKRDFRYCAPLGPEYSIL